MSASAGNKVLELFGCSTAQHHDWRTIIRSQQCPFANTRCFKVRKSDPGISIGTCTVRYGQKQPRGVVVCPNRLLERRQVFTDCLHLLTQHTPGNELHIVPEVSIPGGSVDYFLVSVKRGRVKDFAAIEFQTLDTTGTVWPERQRLVRQLGLRPSDSAAVSAKGFGMNWKMTAKTTLVQLHHKVQTLEHVGKRIVLVLQDCLLDYLRREFRFSHLQDVRVGDALHIHAYRLEERESAYRLELATRLSTDAAGVAECLGLQAESKIELETLVAELERKLSANTLMTLDRKIPLADEMPAD